jgi:hypothetical protein
VLVGKLVRLREATGFAGVAAHVADLEAVLERQDVPPPMRTWLQVLCVCVCVCVCECMHACILFKYVCMRAHAHEAVGALDT